MTFFGISWQKSMTRLCPVTLWYGHEVEALPRK